MRVAKRIDVDRGPTMDGNRLKVYLVVARVVASASGLVQLGVLARLLSAEEFGIVAVAIAVSAYVQMLGEPLIVGYERLGHSVQREDSGVGAPRSAAHTGLMSLAVIVPVLAMAVGVIVGEMWIGLAIGVASVSAAQTRWVTLQYLNWDNQQAFGTATMVNGVSRLGFTVGIAAITRDGALAVLAGGVFSVIATEIVAPRSAPFSWNWSGVRKVLIVGIPTAIASLAAVSLTAWPTVAGAQLLDTDEFAEFAAQWSLANAIYVTTAGFILIFGFPLAKRAWDDGDREGARATVMRYFVYSAVGGAALVGAFSAGGEFITRILIGGEYAGTAVPTATVAIGAIGTIAATSGWLLRLQYRQRTMATVSLIAATVQVPIVWLATDWYGLAGLLGGVGVVMLGRSIAMLLIESRRSWARPLGYSVAMMGAVWWAAAGL